MGALLLRFRPSLPWGFAAGSGSILGVAGAGAAAAAAAEGNSQEKKVAKIIIFYGFQKLH